MALRLPHAFRRDSTWIANWELVRKRGRRRFILVAGVLGFALPGAVMFTLVNHWLGSPGPSWGKLVINLLLAPIFGYWFGAATWSRHERRYEHRRGERQDRATQ